MIFIPRTLAKGKFAAEETCCIMSSITGIALLESNHHHRQMRNVFMCLKQIFHRMNRTLPTTFAIYRILLIHLEYSRLNLRLLVIPNKLNTKSSQDGSQWRTVADKYIDISQILNAIIFERNATPRFSSQQSLGACISIVKDH
jgi:hypothetical protein